MYDASTNYILLEVLEEFIKLQLLKLYTSPYLFPYQVSEQSTIIDKNSLRYLATRYILCCERQELKKKSDPKIF